MKKVFRNSLLGCLVAAVVQIAPVQADTLQSIWQAAKYKDIQLMLAATEVQLQQQKRQQASAATKPSVGISANVSMVENSAIGVSDLAQSYSLDVKQAIYHKDIIIQVDQVELLIGHSRLGLQLAEQQLMLRTSQAYFNYLSAVESLALHQQELAAVTQRHKAIQARHQVGLNNLVDVQTSKMRVDMTGAQIVAAAGAVANAKESLREITSEEVTQLANLPNDIELTDLLLIPTQTPNVWVTAGLEDNLRLRQLEYQWHVAQLNIAAQQAQSSPTIDLVGQYKQSYNSRMQYGPDANETLLGIQISMPLYTGGYVEAKVAEARIQKQQLLHQLEATKRSLTKSIRTALQDVDSVNELMYARKQVLASAQINQQAMAAAVNVGSRTNIDLLEVEQNVFAARRDLSQAKYQYLMAQLQLLLTTGKLNESVIEGLSDLMSS